MARYQVILAYDGTAYCGFQRQGQAPTVQLAVEDALRKMGWQGKTIYAAGRTDTGVHASGQVIAFDLNWKHDTDTLVRALNAHLPMDVAAKQAKMIDDHFHPRFDARYRSYQYRIYSDTARDAFLDRIAWRVYPALRLDLLNQAAVLLIGKHDFAAFGTPPRIGGSTERVVFQAGWERLSDNLIQFQVSATAFLYHMVRRMVMLQVLVAQGELTLDDLKRSIDEQVILTPGLAPPHGLFLTDVGFSENVLLDGLNGSAATFETL